MRKFSLDILSFARGKGSAHYLLCLYVIHCNILKLIGKTVDQRRLPCEQGYTCLLKRSSENALGKDGIIFYFPLAIFVEEMQNRACYAPVVERECYPRRGLGIIFVNTAAVDTAIFDAPRKKFNQAQTLLQMRFVCLGLRRPGIGVVERLSILVFDRSAIGAQGFFWRGAH